MTRIRWASGIAVVALTATACGMGGDDSGNNGDSAEGEGSSGGHLVYAEQFAPAAAWAVETNDAFTLTRAGCLETLVKYSNEGEPEPMLATEWSQVEPTTWEFTLRDDVKFQDGTPMDAEAVAGALTHVLEVEVPARAFNADVISGVEATDASTVQVSTPKPDPLVPLRVANPNAGILAPKAYEGEQIDIHGHLHRSVHGDRGGAGGVADLGGQRRLLGRRGRPGLGGGAVRRRRRHPGHPAADR